MNNKGIGDRAAVGYVSKQLRASAKGESCTLEFPGVCNHDPETVVLAHLPSSVKGLATKSDDWHAVFACSACHEHMDHNQRHANMATYQLRALRLTQKTWFDEGLLTIAGDKEPKPKHSGKSLPPKPIYR